MRKRITSLLLALVMLLSLAPTLGGTARAAEEDRIEVHTYQQLQDALEQPGFNEIVLMEDIDAGELTLEYNNTTVGVQEPIVIGANSFPWLDLNGHTLRLDTVFKLSHYIKVSGSSQLTIDDNSPGKTGKIIGHLSERYFVDEPSGGRNHCRRELPGGACQTRRRANQWRREDPAHSGSEAFRRGIEGK